MGNPGQRKPRAPPQAIPRARPLAKRQPRRRLPRPQLFLPRASGETDDTVRRYLIAGLLVWVPLGITIWVLVWLVTTLDQTLLLVPESARPEAVVGFHIPGLGVLLSLAILLLTGVIAANFFGARVILLWESVLGRIPVVKSIYSSVKQVSDTLLSETGYAFRKALLVEYPYPGCWTIAFQTGFPAVSVAGRLPGEHVSVYVPTTPNPTSGFFIILQTSTVHVGDLTVDQAFKNIIPLVL